MTPEPHEFPEMDSILTRETMGRIERLLPPLMGFTIFVFDYGPNGRLAYGSTAERATMIATVREWLRRAENA